MGIRMRSRGNARLGRVVASVLERFAEESGLAHDEARHVASRAHRAIVRAGGAAVTWCEQRDGVLDVVVEPIAPEALPTRP